MAQLNLQKIASASAVTPPTNLYGIFFDLAGLPKKIDDVGVITDFNSSGVSIVPVTHAQLKALIDATDLVVGTYYLVTDFATVYEQPDFDNTKTEKVPVTKTGTTEPLICYAVSDTEIAGQCMSTVYSKDIVEYDPTYIETEYNNDPAKGKITRRVDEYGNSTPYDLRVVKFLRYFDTPTSQYKWWYDKENSGLSVEKFTFDQTDSQMLCKRNYIDSIKDSLIVTMSTLPNLVFGKGCNDNILTANSFHSTIGLGSNNNTFENFLMNTVGMFCSYNTNKGQFQNNLIDNNFEHNTILDAFYSNTVGLYFKLNTISKSYYDNIIGDGFQNNTTLRNFSDNTIGDWCENNLMVGEFSRMIFGDSFKNNIFRQAVVNSVKLKTIGNYFTDNIFEGSVNDNTIGDGFRYNKIKCDFESNTIGNSFDNNTIEGSFSTNTISDEGFQKNMVLGVGAVVGNTINPNSKISENIITHAFTDNILTNSDINRNTITGTFAHNTLTSAGIQDNLFEDSFTFNDVQSYIVYNTFKKGCVMQDNNFLGVFSANKVEGTFDLNTFHGTARNIFSGCTFHLNICGDNFDDNVISTSSIVTNNFGTGFSRNIIEFCEFEFVTTSTAFNNNKLYCKMSTIVIDYNFTFNDIKGEMSNLIIEYKFDRNIIDGKLYGDAPGNIHTIGYQFQYNKIKGEFGGQNVGHDFQFNEISGKLSEANSLGEYFSFNILNQVNMTNGTYGTNFVKNQLTNVNWTNNTVGNFFQENVVENSEFTDNTVLDYCQKNKFTGTCSLNQIGEYFQWNIFESGLDENDLSTSAHFKENLFRGSFIKNIITGTHFQLNIVDKDFTENISIGNYFQNNRIHETFNKNSVGQAFQNNDITGSFILNTIGTDFIYNRVKGHCTDNIIGNFFGNNEIETDFTDNTFGDYCYGNEIGAKFTYNLVHDNFSWNKFTYSFSGEPIGIGEGIQEFPDRAINAHVFENGFGRFSVVYDFSLLGNALGPGDERILNMIPRLSRVTRMTVMPDGLAGGVGAKLECGVSVEDEQYCFPATLLTSLGFNDIQDVTTFSAWIPGMQGVIIKATDEAVDDGRIVIFVEYRHMNIGK